MLKPLVSSKWLSENFDTPHLVVLYTTLTPKKERIATEVISHQIKGAHFFDLKEKFSDQKSDLPNTFPSEQQFQEECRNLGINKDSTIVVYDTLGIYSSPRVWFLFKSMGHQKVFVLDGGLKEWINLGYPTVNKNEECFEQGNFEAKFQPGFLSGYRKIHDNLSTQAAQVIDARSALRFKAETPEPREGLRSGNIPNSCNLHYASLLENGRYKSKENLLQLFEPFKNEKELIFSCGSGITACILYVAASDLIQAKLSIYDGSWTEWGSS